MSKKKLSEKFYEASRDVHELGRTFKPWKGDATKEFAWGFSAGASALMDRFKGLIDDIVAFEKTDAVRMADESEMVDALQWNLRQYRTLVSILECEREYSGHARAVVKMLEKVLAGEKIEEVRV